MGTDANIDNGIDQDPMILELAMEIVIETEGHIQKMHKRRGCECVNM